MTKQERFNAIMDAIKAIGNAEKYSYTDHQKTIKEMERADSILRGILTDELGDWGDLRNPKIAKLWDNYDKQEE